MRHAGGVDGEELDPDSETVAEPFDAPEQSTLTIVLLAVALLAIPIGLILLYLGITAGTPSTRPAIDLTGATTSTIVAAAGNTPLLATDLDGQWTVGVSNGSSLGYRIDGTIASGSTRQSFNGRSPLVEGGLVVRNGTVEAVAVQADLRALATDDASRQDTPQGLGLTTDATPLIRLRFEDDHVLPAVIPADGAIPLRLSGELLLHGVAQPFAMEVEAKVRRDEPLIIELTGNATITWADFAVKPPDGDNPRTIAPTGELQVRLVLSRKVTPGTVDRSITR